MPRKVISDTQKIEILNYAKEHGAKAAAQVYHLDKSSIMNWNRKFQIYPSKTQRRFTVEQRMEILEYAHDHGAVMAARHFNVDLTLICEWNKIYAVYTPQKKARTFKNAQRRTILLYANRYGLMAACRKFDVSKTMLSNWNKKMGLYTKYNKTYTIEQKYQILMDARDNGVSATAQKYDINPTIISQWNKKLHVFPFAPKRKFTEAERKKFLTEARDMITFDPVTFPTVAICFDHLYQKYDIHPAHLYLWNRQYHIVPTRYKSYTTRPITDAEIELVKQTLAENRGRVAPTARKLDMTQNRIRRVMEMAGIAKHR